METTDATGVDAARVEDLEVKVAFLERHVGELDGVIRQLYDELAALRRDLAALGEAVRLDQPIDRTHEKPPHY